MATELPEDSQLKRRARRRLIGAIALVLLAVIVLPMIFDAEQKPLDQDVSIQIPSQGDYVAKAPPPGSTPAVAGDKKAAPDTKDAAKDVPKDAAPADAKAAPVVTPPAPEVKPEAKAEAKAAAKAETPPEPKADAKSAAKAAADKAAEDKARAQAEAKRAAALLNGAATAPTSSKSDKSEKVASADAFAIQIGAFSSEEKAQEVRDKLSAAGLKSYAEKVATKSGDVTRVRAGPFASKDAAESAKAKIAGLGFSSATVVHR